MKPTIIIVLLSLFAVPAARAKNATGAKERLERPAPKSGLKYGGARGWLDALTREALRANPSLKQVEARVRVASAKVKQATAWPDPVLSFSFVNFPSGTFRFRDTPMTGFQIGLTQWIPFPGRRTAAGKVERGRVAVERARLDELQNQLAGVVRSTAVELFYLRAARVIILRHARVLEAMIKVADAKYKVQQGTLPATLKARVERSQLDDRLQRIARRRERVEAALNVLLGRTPLHRFKLPAPPKERRMKHSLAKLFSMAERERALLRIWRRQAKVHEYRRSHAKYGYLPDLFINIAYWHRKDSGMDPVNGRDFWTFGFGLRIPLFSIPKTIARVKEAKAGIAVAQAGYRSAKLRVQRGIKILRDAILRFDKRLALYRKRILPQARAALGAARAAYVVGKIDFLRLLDHQRALFKYELMEWRLRIDRSKHWEALRAAVGRGS